MAEKKKVAGYYPLFLKIQGKRCVVVGGGTVALRKAKALMDCGADVTVISPKVLSPLLRLAEGGAIRWVRRHYRAGDLRNAAVVISATDSREVNRKIAHQAKKARTLLNVADDPDLSDFIVPAVVRRGGLTLAISTGGRSPALSRKLRERLEKMLGEEYASLVEVVEDIRSSLKREGITVDAESWQAALDVDRMLRLLRKGGKAEAKRLLSRRLKQRT